MAAEVNAVDILTHARHSTLKRKSNLLLSDLSDLSDLSSTERLVLTGLYNVGLNFAFEESGGGGLGSAQRALQQYFTHTLQSISVC